jgi:hypothetical protein
VTKKHLFLTVVKAGKSEIKELADSVIGKHFSWLADGNPVS